MMVSIFTHVLCRDVFIQYLEQVWLHCKLKGSGNVTGVFRTGSSGIVTSILNAFQWTRYCYRYSVSVYSFGDNLMLQNVENALLYPCDIVFKISLF